MVYVFQVDTLFVPGIAQHVQLEGSILFNHGNTEVKGRLDHLWVRKFKAHRIKCN